MTRGTPNNLREWALEWMDPLNEVLFDMAEDGGHPQEIVAVLVTRAVAELAMQFQPRAHVEVQLRKAVNDALDGVFGAGTDFPMTEGTA